MVGAMTDNPLVEFLAAYGPTSDGNNMYDEFVVAAARKAGIDPIVIPEERSDRIIEDLFGSDPRSVILTGTAGDGKTYTARRVVEKLTGNALAWTNTQETFEWTDAGSGRRIVFIKDLSEVGSSLKSRLIPRMIKAFLDSGSSEFFVVCANDGHLLRTWREHMGADSRGEQMVLVFQELLRDDRELPTSEGYAFRLVNMSRTSHADTIDSIVDQVCAHKGWEGCSATCEAMQAGTCPIRINRDILLEDGLSSMRRRLRSLVEIAAADDRHLSIRQIIILVVNALLGDSKHVYQSPLMSCPRARQRADDKDYRFTNPYTNVFGDNHPQTRRKQYTAFAHLADFRIGFETNNFFDDELLVPEAGTSLPDHDLYGLASFGQLRANYHENPGEHMDDLRSVLVAQRRRLFFVSPDVSLDGRESSPWQLSVHSFGDLYLNLLRSEKDRDEEIFRRTRPRIIKGLNRALTGALTETSDKLWLTQPSGVYRGADVPILVTSPIGWFGAPYSLLLNPPHNPGRPPMLQLWAAYPQPRVMTELPITPTLFEYLMRVADGALPMSFSNQCFQDVRNFQIRCVGAILKLEREIDAVEFKAVNTGGERLAERTIGVLGEG